jgi:16S rRNA (cytosine967-C5)-methyltransferase
VEQVLTGRSDFELIDPAEVLPTLSGIRRGPYLQLWPHRHDTDAMFGAFLRRRSLTGQTGRAEPDKER